MMKNKNQVLIERDAFSKVINEEMKIYLEKVQRRMAISVFGHFYDEYEYDFQNMIAYDKNWNSKFILKLENDKIKLEDDKFYLPDNIQRQYKEWQFNEKMKDLLTE